MWIPRSCSNQSEEELYDHDRIRSIDQIHDWEVKDLTYIVFPRLVVIHGCKRYHCFVFENVGLPGYILGCFYRESETVKFVAMSQHWRIAKVVGYRLLCEYRD